MENVNFSDFTLRYLTRRGMMPLIAKRVKDGGGENILDRLLRQKCFRLSSLFYWERTPEGHEFWQELNKKIIEEYEKLEGNTDDVY